MLEQSILQNYLDILREELVPATGCTEPIAIAFVSLILAIPLVAYLFDREALRAFFP